MRLLEQHIDLLFRPDKRLFPKAVNLVVEEFDESDKEAERVGTLDDDPLEEDSTDALADVVWGRFGADRIAEEEKHEGDEEEGMSRGVAQLIGNGGEHVVLTWKKISAIQKSTY